MGIKREVTARVYCDVCKRYIGGWYNTSILWTKYLARQKGASTGEKIKCKECRIKERVNKCRLIKEKGKPETDGGLCVGFGKSEENDEPCTKCMNCIANASFDWEEEARRLSIQGRMESGKTNRKRDYKENISLP